jgi:hypothetical protein
MKTLLTLLLLLSSNIIFADEEAKIRGAFGDIFDIGMTDQDTGTKTPNIDEGKDLYQVQLALAYAARDTQMIETKLKSARDTQMIETKYSLNGALAKTTTNFFAYVAVASYIYNNRNDVGSFVGIKYEDFKAYIASVNVLDEEDFMNERDFNRMVDQLSLGTTPKEAAFRAFSDSSAQQRGQNWKEFSMAYFDENYHKPGEARDRAWYQNATRSWSDLQEMLNGDTQAALMNLRQSIYNVCVSCPPI